MTQKDIDQLVTIVQCQLAGRVSNLRLVMGEKGLILHGRTRSYYAKQLAQEVVMKVTAAPLFSNHIEIL